jgi:two-component system nitrate/nitrite response regulator NarL
MTRTTTAQHSRKPREPKPSIGIAGACRWSRELLVTAMAKRLKADTVDLGRVDSGLASRVAQQNVRLLIMETRDSDGSRLLQRIHQACPRSKIVALTLSNDQGAVIPLIRKGVAAVIPPDAGLGELITDLRLFWRNDWACTPAIARLLVQNLDGDSRNVGPDSNRPLSPREMDVAFLLEQGLPNKLIADRLNISQGTVKNHIHRILVKTALARRADIPAYLSRVRSDSK